ncbi:MAG: tRNA lysidine(34) synthetase TilS, partial [Bacteroidetes bacterium RIFCSPHIGHO2_02_FULL_44_7]
MKPLELHIAKILAPFREHLVLVACSGGVDSMVLSELLRRLGFQLELAHVNYGLRGTDSEADMQLVLDYGEKHKIPVHLRRANPEDFQKNTQATAREFRYAWFDELIAQREKAVIALAHHSDDQVETFFLNLARKSGVMGLACMPFQHRNWIRPLLDFSKNDLLDFAKLHRISWREDASNTKLTYKRNILRSVFIPELTAYTPELKENVLLMIHYFQEKQRELETELAPVASQWQKDRELQLDTWRAF